MNDFFKSVMINNLKDCKTITQSSNSWSYVDCSSN